MWDTNNVLGEGKGQRGAILTSEFNRSGLESLCLFLLIYKMGGGFLLHMVVFRIKWYKKLMGTQKHSLTSVTMTAGETECCIASLRAGQRGGVMGQRGDCVGWQCRGEYGCNEGGGCECGWGKCPLVKEEQPDRVTVEVSCKGTSRNESKALKLETPNPVGNGDPWRALGNYVRKWWVCPMRLGKEAAAPPKPGCGEGKRLSPPQRSPVAVLIWHRNLSCGENISLHVELKQMWLQ